MKSLIEEEINVDVVIKTVLWIRISMNPNWFGRLDLDPGEKNPQKKKKRWDMYCYEALDFFSWSVSDKYIEFFI